MDKGYANRPAYISLWVHLLMMANHNEAEFMWNGGIIKIQPGQLLTGRKALSERTGIPESSVEDILNFFEKATQIRQQKTTKHRLITILNWEKHQISDNKATTEQQQADTNKNVKNVISIGKDELSPLTAINNKKDMAWNTPADDAEEGVIDYDGDGSVKSTAPASKKKYPNALPVFKLFLQVLGTYPANWNMNKTQLQAAENLYTERGLDKVRNALEYYKENKDDKYCPQISQPSDLDSKYAKLSQFKNKHDT